MLIELVWMIGLPAFYHWLVCSGGQLQTWPTAAWLGQLQASFLAQSVLLALMTIATCIDFDEKTIPDMVTIPGTVFALAFAWFCPKSMLPIGVPPESLFVLSPFPTALLSPSPQALAIGIACLLGWCVGLLPRTATLRFGLFKGLRFLLCGVFRKRRRKITLGIAAMFASLSALTFLAWQFGAPGSLRWQALISSLIGMAGAGGFVWAIRVVASTSYGIEALGFGDVTLMAMIGAFLGWQAGLICFFLAPFTGIGIVLAKWIITGNRQVAFGPFICAGACFVIFLWTDIWGIWGKYFSPQMTPILISLLLVGLVALGATLALLRLAKRLMGID